MTQKICTYKVEYTSFKGSVYANSGNSLVVDAVNISSLIKKLKSLVGISESAINKIEKL